MSEKAQALVQQLVAAGEWPDPRLLEAILAEGKDARGPLLELVRRPTTSHDDEVALSFAVCLLGNLRTIADIPVLINLLRRFDNETLQDVSQTLGMFGFVAVEPALAVVCDRKLSANQRAEASTAAILAAGDDPYLRSRVSSVLRDLLTAYVARAAELKPPDVEMVTVLVEELTNLADPQARELIQQAFAANIVDTMMIRAEDVEEMYKEGPEEVMKPEPRAWLEEYQEIYQEELEMRRQQAGQPNPPPA
jgi:hypothetical protein